MYIHTYKFYVCICTCVCVGISLCICAYVCIYRCTHMPVLLTSDISQHSVVRCFFQLRQYFEWHRPVVWYGQKVVHWLHSYVPISLSKETNNAFSGFWTLRKLGSPWSVGLGPRALGSRGDVAGGHGWNLQGPVLSGAGDLVTDKALDQRVR